MTVALRIGVISDTHIPARGRSLPAEVFRIFADVDLILHAGDLVTLDVLTELEALAPVCAVYGNVDPPEVRRRLTARRIVEAGRFRIGLCHGDGGRSAVEVAARAFSGVDCVVFGHSHQPLCEWRGGVLFFNPGSPTDRRREAHYSVGLLRAGEALTGEIIRWPGGAQNSPFS